MGAYVLLDSFQALGTVPFDVQQLNVDFCTGGVLKWLCGGPGTGYLYVRPELAKKLEPTFTGWMGHRNPFGFEIGPNQYTDGIYRFTQGTPNIAALHAARPGVKIIARSRHREHPREIEAADGAADRDGRPARLAGKYAARSERRGGTVSIDMPDAERVCAELLKRDVLVDYRPKAGVRFSPHFYNTDEELGQGDGSGGRYRAQPAWPQRPPVINWILNR